MLTHRHQKAKAFRVKLTDCQTDDEFIQLWLHGKSAHTKAAYLRHATQAFIENRPLERVKIEDVAAFCEGMEKQGYAVGSIRRRLYAVKSLLSFGQSGYLPQCWGLVDLPTKRKLSERILSESEILQLIELEPKNRNNNAAILVRDWLPLVGDVSFRGEKA